MSGLIKIQTVWHPDGIPGLKQAQKKTYKIELQNKGLVPLIELTCGGGVPGWVKTAIV